MPANNLYFDKGSIQPYTEVVAPCPKCGATDTTRIYRPFAPGPTDRISITDFEGDWLKVHCNDCHYSWPQHTKDWLSNKVADAMKK